MNELNIGFNEKLNELDTEKQTHGCRHTNSKICGNNSIPNICAFTSEDCICKKPPTSWKRQYQKLLKSCNQEE